MVTGETKVRLTGVREEEGFRVPVLTRGGYAVFKPHHYGLHYVKKQANLLLSRCSLWKIPPDILRHVRRAERLGGGVKCQWHY